MCVGRTVLPTLAASRWAHTPGLRTRLSPRVPKSTLTTGSKLPPIAPGDVRTATGGQQGRGRCPQEPVSPPVPFESSDSHVDCRPGSHKHPPSPLLQRQGRAPERPPPPRARTPRGPHPVSHTAGGRGGQRTCAPVLRADVRLRARHPRQGKRVPVSTAGTRGGRGRGHGRPPTGPALTAAAGLPRRPVSRPPPAVAQRGPYREAHLGAAKKMLDDGKLVLAGALADPVDGGLFIFKGCTKVTPATRAAALPPSPPRGAGATRRRSPSPPCAAGGDRGVREGGRVREEWPGDVALHPALHGRRGQLKGEALDSPGVTGGGGLGP